MKIAQVNEIANVPSTLAKGLRERGHEVLVVPLQLIGGKRPTWQKLGLLPWRLREILAVNRDLRAGRFDVVHLHYAYLGWAGILGRYPYHLHCHGTDVRSGLHDPVRRPFVKRALTVARRVYYSTPDLAEHVHPVRADGAFVPNPIDVDLFCPGRRSSDGRPRVLFVSALSTIKGVEQAFQTIDALNRRAPGLEVAVFGFGAQAAEYVGRPGTTVLPPVCYDRMPDTLRDFDVVVGQLRLGILSMSELEAMACGKPVVGAFRYPDVYDEPPPIHSGASPDELAERILALADDSGLRRMEGERARQWVVQRHDYRRVAELMESHYLAC